MIWTSLLTGGLKILRAVPPWLWVILALAGWGAWQKHSSTRATQAAERAAAAAKLSAAAAEAQQRQRQIEADLNTKAREQADAYNAKVAAARRAAAAARADLDRLRDAIAAAPAGRATGADPAASGSTDGAAAVRDVLRECAGTVQALAEAADADATKVMALQAYVRTIPAACPAR